MPDAGPTAQPPIDSLLSQTASDGRQWLNSELALARARLSSAAGQAVVALVLGFSAVAFMLAGLIVLIGVGVALLAPYVGGLITAGAIVGGATLLIAVMLALAAVALLRSTRTSLALFDRWP